MSWENDQIARLDRRRPKAVQLARLAALAARIEPTLLRRLRVDIRPDLDVGVEADMWFSPLVESRNPVAVVLRPEAASELRRDLYDREPVRAEHARRVIAELHAQAPPTIRLLETLNWLTLTPGSQPQIEEIFRSLVVSVLRERRVEFGEWAHRISSRLDRSLRETESFRTLLWARPLEAAARQVALPEGQIKDWLWTEISRTATRRDLPIAVDAGQITLEVPLRQADYTVEVPDTDPLLLEASSPTLGTYMGTVLRSQPHEIASTGFPVKLRTASGSVYLVPLRVIDTGEPVWSLAVLSDGRRALSGSKSGDLKLWELDTGRLLRTFEGHKNPVTAIALLADGRRALSGSDDRTLRLWDLESGAELFRIRGHEGSVRSVAVLAGRRRALSASDDRTLRLWDLESGAELLRLAGHEGSVTSVALFADGRRALSGSDDRTLRVWDLESGAEFLRIAGHEGSVSSVAVLADGNSALSGSEDRTAKLWDVNTGKCLEVYGGHFFTSVAAFAEGRALLGATDGTLRLWDFAAEEATATPATLLQYFHWDYPADGSLWKDLSRNAQHIAKAGFTAVWLPPPYKGWMGAEDTGYGAYDLFDLGEFDQKGSVRTRYGTREELEKAIQSAHEVGLAVYITAVMDRKIGADHTEKVMATPVHAGNLNIDIGPSREIEAWTKYVFPGRGDIYSKFKWCQKHFISVVYDQATRSRAVYRIKEKMFEKPMDRRMDLTGGAIDHGDDEVRNEFTEWGKWISRVLRLNGFVISDVDQIHFPFLNNWLDYVRSEPLRRELVALGNHSAADVETLLWFSQQTGRRMLLFDAVLHSNMRQISEESYHLSHVFDGTLVAHDPTLTVTFVDNNDTIQNHEEIIEWFRPHAYALILLRKGGFPCVFYPDYFGGGGRSNMRLMLDVLLAARRDHCYGNQNDYFDDLSVVGWTHTGDVRHPKAIAIVMSNSIGGTKRMFVDRPRSRFGDLTGAVSTHTITSEDGYGVFSCADRSVSIWVELDESSLAGGGSTREGTVKW